MVPTEDTDSNPDLEGAILADPSAPESWLVYGHWLQSRGDPRGELVRLQHELEQGATDPKLRAREAELLAYPGILGPLADHRRTLDGDDTPALTWRFGHVDRARFAYDYYSQLDHSGSRGQRSEPAIVDLSAPISALLDSSSGRFVRSLTLGLNRHDPDCEYQSAIDAIAAASRPSLRELFIADFEYPDQIEMSWTTVGDMSALWANLPRLRRVIVQGGGFTLGPLVAPQLEHAEFRTGGLSEDCLNSLIAAELPALHTLRVWFGSADYGGECDAAGAIRLVNSSGLPSLRHLGLMNAEFTDELCIALASVPALARLESLDLSMGTMTERGAAALVANASAFAHLNEIELDRNYIERGGARQLARALPRVHFGAQERPDSWDGELHYYVSVGE